MTAKRKRMGLRLLLAPLGVLVLCALEPLLFPFALISLVIAWALRP